MLCIVSVVMEWPVCPAVNRITNIKDGSYTDLRLTVPTSARLQQDFHRDTSPWLWFTTWDLVPLYHNLLVYIFFNITVATKDLKRFHKERYNSGHKDSESIPPKNHNSGYKDSSDTALTSGEFENNPQRKKEKKINWIRH